MDKPLTHIKLIILISVFGTAFSAIMVRYSTAPSMALVFYRMLLAAAIMLVPGIRALKRDAAQIRRVDLLCCVISGVILSLHFTTYFESVKLTSITCSVVLVNTEIFFISFILLFFFHERFTKRRWLGIAVAFIGSLVIALGDSADLSGSLIGDLYALGSAALLAVYTTMGRLCRRRMSTGSYTAVVYTVAALTTLLLLLLRGMPLTGYGGINWLTALGMTILCTFLGHSVANWSLKFISPAFLSTARLLEPVFSAILGILFFQEIPSLTALIGGAVILAGLYLAADE